MAEHLDELHFEDAPAQPALLLRHFKLHQTAPRLMSLGFAAYLQFMQCQQSDDGNTPVPSTGLSYPIQGRVGPVFGGG